MDQWAIMRSKGGYCPKPDAPPKRAPQPTITPRTFGRLCGPPGTQDLVGHGASPLSLAPYLCVLSLAGPKAADEKTVNLLAGPGRIQAGCRTVRRERRTLNAVTISAPCSSASASHTLR